MKFVMWGAGAVTLVLISWAIAGAETTKSANLFPYEDPKAVAAGEVIYGDYCASCHGANLEGQENWRGGLDDNGLTLAPPHNETGHTWHHPDMQLFMITKHGTAALVGGDYKSAMIGFGDSLSDEEILNVMAFIKSTWPPELIDAHNGINAQAAQQ